MFQGLQVVNLPGLGSGFNTNFTRGKKFFELSNHLGNVLATVSDGKVGVSTDSTTIDHYEADIISAQEYYSFGMQMPGRGYSSDKYRYGFNGKENDNEVKGDGNQQNYGFRIYDPRAGRFLSVDPLAPKYPELTPYQFASNSPIANIDLDGAEALSYMSQYQYNGSWGYLDFLKAVPNTGGNIYNGLIAGTWNSGVENARSLSRGTWLKDRGNELRQITAGVKNEAVATYNYHSSTPIKQQLVEAGNYLIQPQRLEEALTFYALMEMPMPKVNRNLLKVETKNSASAAVLNNVGSAESKFFTQGGSGKILNEAGEMSFNVKNGMLEGSFIENSQSVLFDAKVSINAKNIDFLEIGIYGEKGYGTTSAQNLITPSTYRNLIRELETQAKQDGYKSGNLHFERRRPDGSKLPDSSPRSIPLKLD